MKRFQCGNNQVFFENTYCLACERELGFVPELLEIEPLLATGNGRYRLADGKIEDREFRKCANYSGPNVCNWMIPVENNNPFCAACRLNQTIPDLSYPENHDYWREIEQAKRRLLFTLLSLELPIIGREEDAQYGLAFAFLADKSLENKPEFTDQSAGGSPIMTGHNQGLITINIAEADPGYREQMRQQMNESYRTLLGHFRHEVGHYYWYRLIFNHYWHTDFVRLFGDENIDYQASLERYYHQGPPTDWRSHYISAYATAHPWEDWAECWAHYMHIMDTLETASSSRLLARDCILNNLGRRHNQSLLTAMQALPIQDILGVWVDLSVAMNNINRSIGLGDFYPFVISNGVMDKLAFIHRIVGEQIIRRRQNSAVSFPVESR